MAPSEIDVDELADRLASGGVLIDVREPDEYRAGHVAGAVSVPLMTVPDRLDVFREAGTAYVICESGGRSRRVCEYLAGVSIDAVNVAGGTGAWIASGRDAVTGDHPR